MGEDFKEEFRNMMLNVLGYFVDNNIRFQIMLDNNDDWSEPLPAQILENGPMITLDMAGYALEETHMTEDNDCVLVVAFGETVYTKTIDMYDVFAILLNGQPVIMKPFDDSDANVFEQEVDTEIKQMKIDEKKEFDIIAKNAKIYEEENADAIAKSMSVFKKYNSSLFK